MLQQFINNNITLTSIIIFIIIFSIVQIVKPAFLYNDNGTIREFGIGYRHKTIVPIWLFSIILGILSYLFVIYLTKITW